MLRRTAILASLSAGIAASGLWLMRAQEPLSNAVETPEFSVSHPECSFFGPQRERFLPRDTDQLFRLSETTARVTGMLGAAATVSQPVTTATMPSAPGGSRTFSHRAATTSTNLIDIFLWGAFQSQGVTPAVRTNDYEFIRRVTLDLTGRIPTADRVTSFVADATPGKRANLVDELLAKPEWVDKWTMYYGDLFKNASVFPNTGVAQNTQGRDAFNQWIRTSLASGKPYNQMSLELIASVGTNSTAQGELNWMNNGRIANVNLRQDDWDQQTADVAETFLGIAHVNCLLCHNGRGHLDLLSLWGSTFTRAQAWGMSSFLSHTQVLNGLSDPANAQSPRTWWVNDNQFRTDYPLNTTTGNRPPRQPIGTIRNIPPVYPFNGEGPKSGEGYRQALAREVTGDFQFARAAVNYVWAYFFGMGIVDPPDQFDPARVDPDNPPPAPWTLQPSNPDLLNALAQDFIQSNYDLKRLMRLIATSDAYQLSSRYDPNAWNPNWQPLFARKLVRRLWGEEIADSMALSSGILNNFNAGAGVFNWAIQFPEPRVEPNPFLQSFLPGNRDDQARRQDGSIQQALVLMNDTTVMSKLNGTATQSLLSRALAGDNAGLINLLYLNILSRYPTDPEKQAATALLGTGNRTQKAQELMWTLYNKVDFLFNY